MSWVQGERDRVESGSRIGPDSVMAGEGVHRGSPEEDAVTGFQSRITRGAAQKLGETT